MQKYGVKLIDLHRKLGLSLAAVHGMINKAPRITNVKMMAEAIGCSFYEFFDFGTSEDRNKWEERDFFCPNCGTQFEVKLFPSGHQVARVHDETAEYDEEASIPRAQKFRPRGISKNRITQAEAEARLRNGLFASTDDTDS